MRAEANYKFLVFLFGGFCACLLWSNEAKASSFSIGHNLVRASSSDIRLEAVPFLCSSHVDSNYISGNGFFALLPTIQDEAFLPGILAFFALQNPLYGKAAKIFLIRTGLSPPSSYALT